MIIYIPQQSSTIHEIPCRLCFHVCYEAAICAALGCTIVIGTAAPGEPVAGARLAVDAGSAVIVWRYVQ